MKVERRGLGFKGQGMQRGVWHGARGKYVKQQAGFGGGRGFPWIGEGCRVLGAEKPGGAWRGAQGKHMEQRVGWTGAGVRCLQCRVKGRRL